MIVVAHPDDELLGLGATMHNLIKNCNATTHVVILGEGITSRSDERDPKLWAQQLQTHRQNIHNAQKAIGYHSLSIYDFADNRFDSHDLLDIIKIVDKEKSAFKPDVIFTHHGGDLNIDHRITFQTVMTVTRPMSDEHTKTILTFETPSGTEWQPSNDPMQFQPNFIVPLTRENVDAKIKGMESYEFEKRKFPHPRSPKALEVLSQLRGLQNGHEYAEAFQLIRHIN